jgi:hypothetical protein
MLQIRWVALSLALVLLAARDQASSAVSDEIEGTWEILSVYRDGEADPLQEGTHLTFANGRVIFMPNVSFNDAQSLIEGRQEQVAVKDVVLQGPDPAAAAFG